MAGALTAAIAAAFSGSSVVSDPYFEYTTLLLPGNGTNGAQNNTFLDGSTNNFTITRNGNTTQGTFSPFSQTGWGNYFDGASDYLTLASNAAFSFGTGSFTYETWFYSTGTTSAANVFYDLSNANGAGSFSVFTTGGVLYIRIGGTGNDLTYTLTSSWINTWHHLAVVRNGTTLTIYLDGTSVATGTRAQDVTQSTPYIGDSINALAGYSFGGYLSNTRVVIGTAVYTGNFTPPTAPLTAISGTSLLTCQSNRFIDNSTNNFTITVNGNTSVVAFSPFNPTASWSAATNGGSGYFDGSGDYLTANSAGLELGSNLFTIDGWFYCTGYNGGGAIYSSVNTYPSSTGLLFYVSNVGTYTIDVNGSNVILSGTAPLNAWTHFAIVRSSTGANGVTLYINGSSIATGTSATNFSSTYAVIGRTGFGAASNYWLGYLSGIRVVVGSANVPSGVPTSPPTAITNTSLLLNFTNAGVYDATSKNDLETVADAQISNTTAKWGSTSIKFDGTGDSLLSPSSNLFTLGDSGANFTIDFWIYVDGTQTSSTVAVAGTWVNNSSAYANRWLIGLYSSGSSIVWHNASAGASAISSSITSSAWNYVAIVRSGSTITMYINGSSVGTQTTNQAYTTDSPLRLGGGITGVGDFKGYIQDFRITKGYARTITTPTAAFPTL